MSKRTFWNLARIIAVAAIFMYLFKSGQFEPSKLKKVLARPGLFMSSAALLFLGVILSAQRWRYLLRIQNISIGLWLAIKLTFTGFFFSTALPGAVSGDIVKAYYIARGQEEKEVLITSILFDRLLGLYTMILIATLALLSSFIIDSISGNQGIWTHHNIKVLSVFIVSLFLFLTIAAVLFMSKNLRRSSLIEFLLGKVPFHTTVTKIYDAVHYFGKRPGMTLKALLLSVLVQTPGFIGIWFLAIILDIKVMTILDYLIAIPVCMVINAIPVAPGGIGVGEAGFRQILLLFGSNDGAELAFLFHSIFFLVALGIGGLIYLFTDVSRHGKS